MKYLSLNKLAHLIGIVIFALLLIQLDLAQLALAFSKINLQYFFLSLLLILPLIIVQAYRWHCLKERQGIRQPLKDSILIYGIGTTIGTLTPARLGDFIMVKYLKDEGHSTSKSMVTVVLSRLFDLFFLLLAGYLGLFFFTNFFQRQIVIGFLIIISTGAIIFTFVKSGLYRSAANCLLKSLILKKYAFQWRIKIKEFFQNFKSYSLKDYFYLSAITLFSWFFYYLIVYCLALSAGLPSLPLIYFISSIAIATLISVLPISILGLGTREATLIFLFSFFNIPAETTLVFSLLIFTISIAAGFLGIFFWFKKPISLARTT